MNLMIFGESQVLLKVNHYDHNQLMFVFDIIILEMCKQHIHFGSNKRTDNNLDLEITHFIL